MDIVQFTADDSIFNNNARSYINKKEIHLWWIDMHRMQIQSPYIFFKLLSEDERKRANRYAIQEIRNNFIFYKGILRTILSKYINSAADKIRFHYLDNGKPQLDDQSKVNQQSSLQFNMSHSGHRALVGLALDRKIGVDIEVEKPLQHMDAIARNYFSTLEFECYNQLEGLEKRKAFYTCWTHKEAYLKATGRGFNFPTNKFSVSLSPKEHSCLIENEVYPQERNKWEFIQIYPELDIAAAVAYHVKSDDVKYL